MWIAFVIILTLIILYLNFWQVEGFDTYFNHDMGAQDILEMGGKPVSNNPLYQVFKKQPLKFISVPEAALQSKYFWHNRDKLGLKLYDKYYENTIGDGVWPQGSYDYDVGVGDSVYDTKFDTLNTNKSIALSSNPTLAAYSLQGVMDYDPATVTKYGNTMMLSQKNF